MQNDHDDFEKDEPHPIYQCILPLRCLLIKESRPEHWAAIQVSIQSYTKLDNFFLSFDNVKKNLRTHIGLEIILPYQKFCFQSCKPFVRNAYAEMLHLSSVLKPKMKQPQSRII